MSFVYARQDKPRGLADAFILGRTFVGHETSCLILGDNIFFGHQLAKVVADAAKEVREGSCGAAIFGYPVKDPERYGVVELGPGGRAISIEEKPAAPKSKLAVPGLYFYDNRVTEIASSLKPSPRGEIEITDVNRVFMHRKELKVFELGRGTAWLDAGTHESLLEASNFIRAIEERQGLLVGSPEEVAFRMGFIDRERLLEHAKRFQGTYAECLRHAAENP
jgi:glucose-1-phosphate thymidylyltransferase